MKESLLFYVALPYTEEVLSIATFFSIKTRVPDVYKTSLGNCGLFLYTEYLKLEPMDNDFEWLLQDIDVARVLVLYSNKDFEGICEYLNSIPERPFNVFPHSYLITN